MVEIDEFLEMRDNKKAFTLFCDRILPCVVGRSMWDKLVDRVGVSKFATATDEAWAIVVMENSWDLWKQMAESTDGKVKDTERAGTKYTAKTRAARKNEGWGSKGIPRFNALMRLIVADRKNNVEVELEYLRKKQVGQEKVKDGMAEGENPEDNEGGLDSFAELGGMEYAEL